MDLFQTMTVFVRVVESGSLTAAGEQCGMSATMVGNHLRALEARLGVTLLRRTTRRQSLTDFGSAYYQRCIDILARIGEADRLAEAEKTFAHGTLRITAPPAFGAERLMPALAAYLASHPQVSIDIVLTDRVVDLIDEGFDLAIRLGTLESSSLIARRLMDYKLTICAAPDYLNRRGTPRHPDELRQHDCLSFSYPAGTEWRWTEKQWRMSDAQQEHVVDINGRVTVNHAQGLRRAALSGLGIAMLPDALVWQDIRQGHLQGILEDYRLPVRPMHLLYTQERFKLPKLRSFVDYAIATFGISVDTHSDAPADAS